jgi:hypothetical protein
MNKIRYQVVINTIDSGMISVLSFAIFIFVKDQYGLDILGYLGILLAITAFVETIHNSLFQKPALMGFKTGLEKVNINKFNILILIFTPLLFVNSLILSGYFLSSFLFISTFIYVQNIRIYDYVKTKYSKILIRSFSISISSILYLVFIHTNTIESDLNNILYFVSFVRVLFILPNQKYLFTNYNLDSVNKGLDFLFNSSMSLIRNRLPLIALLPFGLSFLGVYEVFRNIIEIYMAPSKAIFLTVQKNLDTSTLKKIKSLGFISGLITNFLIILSYNKLLALDIFQIEALKKVNILPILLLYTIFTYYSDTLSLLLQYKKKIKTDTLNKLLTVTLFIFINLVFINYVNFEIYLYLVSGMYFLNILFSTRKLRNDK